MTLSGLEFNQLLVYRDILKDDIIKELQLLSSDNKLEQSDRAYSLAAKLIAWAEEIGISGNLAENYLIYQIVKSQTVFSSAVEKYKGQIGNGLLQAASHDIVIFRKIIQKGWRETLPAIAATGYQSGRIMSDTGFTAVQEWFSGDYSPQEIVNNLINHYGKYGSGEMAVYRAFRWEREHGLVKVAYVDPITFEDIVCYERQKKELIANTEAFLAGRMANNVLLSGARGTGKSSSIKALLNHFFAAGLRLVEVKKDDFKQLPQIMNTLRQLNKKFILFLDDLSFEEFEFEYKHLKSLIDGGMEAMPDNVLLYATSNRRHLIRETWNDRAGSEVHSQDTVNEKISLSDRFGITIHYPSPNQEEYFEIVEKLAGKTHLTIAASDLKKEALKWEMRHSGRSGRVAKQFIAYLAGQEKS